MKRPWTSRRGIHHHSRRDDDARRRRDAPVPDNTGYITEGQFYLRNGRIEPFGSLSRLKQQVNGKTRPDHRTIANTMIQLYASYKETLEKQSMGFRMSNWGPETSEIRRTLRKGNDGPLGQHSSRKGARPRLDDSPIASNPKRRVFRRR